MAHKLQSESDDESLTTRPGGIRNTSGPMKGEFIPPPDVSDKEEIEEALPEQEKFWSPPARFGTVPIEENPLGWDTRRGFRKLYPQVMLPTQVVERISFGYSMVEPNRLFWGDNLHIMRQLPSQSIDLIYIDPPFFSGRQYNVIFGDQNELRSFIDIWEGGLTGYLIWLNARLYEMKRLLKSTGSIFVHCDWHASHYIKCEMDKLFGYEHFRNQIIWKRATPIGGKIKSKMMPRDHDSILYYVKTDQAPYFSQFLPYSEQYVNTYFKHKDENGRKYRIQALGDYSEESRKKFREQGRIYTSRDGKEALIQYLDESRGVLLDDIWVDVIGIQHKAFQKQSSREKIGYPTQKPEALLERIIQSSSKEGDIVADFFCGGGTTPAVAQRLGRRWIACDQSRVAVAITADRIASQVEQISLEQTVRNFDVPDFMVEHWGIYEAKRLSETPPDQFRQFVISAYGAVSDNSIAGIHGHKGAIPVWVGDSSQKSQVTANDVVNFANAIRKTVRYQQDNLRDGTMLAWAFRPDAIQAAQKLREQEATDLNFIRLDMVRIDSPIFREHVNMLSTDKADYSTFLTFVLPPRVEVGWKKLSGLKYRFDVSETAVLNSGGKIINVQWDFNYNDIFTSTQGFSFVRTSSKEPVLQVDYTFPSTGRHRIACKIQDDIGGEGLWIGYIEVK